VHRPHQQHGGASPRHQPDATPRGATPWLRARLVVDRAVALVASLLLAPIVVVLAVLIRRHDGGRALIRVERIGRGGRPFRMWKLRSMRAEQADGTAGGARLTGGADDDRITPIGRRLRSYHLDELPQLWNVVAGHMALLGPRPEDAAYVDGNDVRWRPVLAVPPGIAGPTQVIVSDWEREALAGDPDGDRYRSSILPAKLAIDRWYVASASPATDLLVAGTLARRLLPGTESWTLKRRVRKDVPEAAPAFAFLRAREAARQLMRSRRELTVDRKLGSQLTTRVAQALDARVARRSDTDHVMTMRPMPHAGSSVEAFDDHLVVVDPRRPTPLRLANGERSVWLRCDGHHSIGDIAEELAHDTGRDELITLHEVAAFTLELIEAGTLVDAAALDDVA
jgi:lipopolysaccharide/colanic/teichoic acid biosynthesis glycosyltransferase